MIPDFLKEKHNFIINKPRSSFRFIDRTIKKAASVILNVFAINYYSKNKGLFQFIDARIKFISLLVGVFFINLSQNIYYNLIIVLPVISLFIILSNLKLSNIYKKAGIAAFFFGFLIFLPASLNIFVKGEPLFILLDFKEEKKFLIYNIPQKIYITVEGIKHVLRLSLKIFNSIILTLLIIYTTGFDNLIKAMAYFKLPSIIILIFSLSFRFIFILSKTLLSTYQAIKLRWFTNLNNKDINKIISGRVGYIFRKAFSKYEKVYNSMLARGFDEKLNIFYFDKLKTFDYFFLLFFLLIFAITFFI